MNIAITVPAAVHKVDETSKHSRYNKTQCRNQSRMTRCLGLAQICKYFAICRAYETFDIICMNLYKK